MLREAQWMGDEVIMTEEPTWRKGTAPGRRGRGPHSE